MSGQDEPTTEDLPADVEPHDVASWVEEVKGELSGSPPRERIEGEVLQRVLQRADNLPNLPPETRIRIIEATRDLIQYFL